jgi:hypothetical protein
MKLVLTVIHLNRLEETLIRGLTENIDYRKLKEVNLRIVRPIILCPSKVYDMILHR